MYAAHFAVLCFDTVLDEMLQNQFVERTHGLHIVESVLLEANQKYNLSVLQGPLCLLRHKAQRT